MRKFPVDAPTRNVLKTLEKFEKVREQYRRETAEIRTGGEVKAIERQHSKGRLTVRERIQRLHAPLRSRPHVGG